MSLTPADIPVTLYIHIPWCVRKCPYCDFNSHQQKGELPEEIYIQALLDDLDTQLEAVSNRFARSIFFGGGTPSLFSSKNLGYLLEQIDRRWPLPRDIEITLEANPGASEIEKFKRYRQIGINRISLGIQSFNHEALKRLGRIHDGDQSVQAIQAVIDAGFDDFNLDLMFGLPEQTIAEALSDLQTAMRFNPSHLSWYQLTLEPNTLFYKHPPKLPDDDYLWDMYNEGQSLLKQNNFRQYEVSAYAHTKPSIHNLNYWEFGDYLAIGAGAHSKVTMNNQDILRTQRFKSPKIYMESLNKISQTQNIAAAELPFEYMLNTLRLKQGTPISMFVERTGLPLSIIESKLKVAQAKKWLAPYHHTLQATDLGLQYLNNLVELFID